MSNKKEDISSDENKKSKPSRKRITPEKGRTRGPHPPSPKGKTVLALLEKLPREGFLAKNPTGYIFLDVDDEWIFSVQEEMEKFGYEIPPYFMGTQAVGAHISVVPTDFAKRKWKTGEVEVGRKVTFEVVRAGPSFPNR